MKRLGTWAWILALAAGIETGAWALTVTVAPECGTADFNSIQAAINHCASNNPAGGSHTIQVAAGTYDYREGGAGTGEETFWSHDTVSGTNTADGLGDPYTPGTPITPSESLIVINDVTEEVGGPGTTNRYLDGLTISGGWDTTFSARTGGETIIDAEKASDFGRVMYIRNDNVRLEGVTLKGGRLNTPNFIWYYGCGLLAHGAGLTVSDIEVEDCEITSGQYNMDCLCFGGKNNTLNTPGV